MSDHILVERADGIATVTINRPKMRNAVSLAMWTAIGQETQALAKDDSVRAIVFRGAGTDASPVAYSVTGRVNPGLSHGSTA